ncbi:sugar kinase [uncultured Cohaesibacter sp.]|uniref:sugar kinase n=1 Tax=uncultured Cohaesibacter sp. TaxID=1002546 RepID=UPI00292D2598|nr:sugar kinase [uncultured Cohaesibacter sp.]
MTNAVKIACIGECMIELAPAGNGLFKQGFAGDTFNTAAYLSRQYSPDIEVSYVTGLGKDPMSDGIRKALEAEDIRTDSITMVEDKNPGLYMIENDDTGERFFTYWRNDAAAKKMFAGWSIEKIAELLGQFDVIYFSGITLAILDEAQRTALFEAIAQLKGKVKVGFDPNYRPKLWPDSDICRAAFERAASLCDFALVTADDHVALWGEADGMAIAKQWKGYGAREVVVKEGASSCILLTDDDVKNVPPAAKLKPKDTTGAGDSFAAGYLGKRALGGSQEEAAKTAHGVAGQVIMHPGAIIDKSVWTRVK